MKNWNKEIKNSRCILLLYVDCWKKTGKEESSQEKSLGKDFELEMP